VSRLTDLIAQAKSQSPQLGADLEREFKALSSRLPFGLNFERHRPEVVELPLRPIRKGDKVRVLPSRGSAKKGDQRLWQVRAIYKAKKVADLALLSAEAETQSVALEDLVVVAEFRDTIYPGLISTGKVQRGGDKPFHTVINGENYHVLKALTYTHRGKIDAIYIDPPYNTGAKDWKYNNDYVEGDDLYRHSKWLAMMERRLLVAKELLNPADSVLIVTIDEKEYLRLGLLLEQLFPEATTQMVSSVINPKGASRGTGFRRTDEYIFVAMIGRSTPARLELGSEWSSSAAGAAVNQDDVESPSLETPEWTSMMRRGSHAARSERPGLFFPIYAAFDGSRILEVGESVPIGSPMPADRVEMKTIWPLRSDGSEGVWQVGPAELRNRIQQGRVRLGRATAYGFVVNYLPDGAYATVMSERFEILGRAPDGSLIARGRRDTRRIAPSQWKISSHNASEHGTTLLGVLLPRRTFPFPKSLYAVEDSLRFFTKDKPNAVILDFFSGSGTTAHAVMRLNRQDNGRRQCISVTNNEVAAEEQKALREQGLRPGDTEWEKHGICDYITKPRVASAITGETPNGEPIKGDYKFTDEFPMSAGFEENAEFFNLTYEAKSAVNHNLAFTRIAPLLWMRAGANGSRIKALPMHGWAIADTYGLLTEVDEATPFIHAVKKAKGLRIAFIVTDDDRRFQATAKRLPHGVEPVRLYESYLSNFSFTSGE
jgi:adenine-specific DNA-methyltransferase